MLKPDRNNLIAADCRGLPLITLICGCLCSSVTIIAQWAGAVGGDHGGKDWTPKDGAVISGVHTNIKKFYVAEKATVKIHSSIPLKIYAEEVIVDGTLDGTGAGFSGGRPGAGPSDEATGSPGDRGDGPGGGYPGGGAKSTQTGKGSGGGAGSGGTLLSRGGIGGEGGLGGHISCCCFGPPAGSGGPPAREVTLDENAILSNWKIEGGSGGGGGGGGGSGKTGRTAGTGGHGGNGGAAIIIVAKSISVKGKILANGTSGGDGKSGDNNCGGGGAGGGGSGGLVILVGHEVTANKNIFANGGNGGKGGHGKGGDPTVTGGGAGGGGGGAGGMIIIAASKFEGQVDSPKGGTEGEPGGADVATQGTCIVQEGKPGYYGNDGKFMYVQQFAPPAPQIVKNLVSGGKAYITAKANSNVKWVQFEIARENGSRQYVYTMNLNGEASISPEIPKGAHKVRARTLTVYEFASEWTDFQPVIVQ